MRRLGLPYNSDELIRLRKTLGHNAEINVYTDRVDLTYVVVRNPQTSELFRVPCIAHPEAVEGITEYQQQLILKMCRTRGKKNPSLADLVQARIDLAELVAQEARSSKYKGRKFAKRAGDVKLPSSSSTPKEAATKPGATSGQSTRLITSLEYSIEELALVDVAELDEGWE